MRRVVVALVVGWVVSWCGVRAAQAQDLERVPEGDGKPIVDILAEHLQQVTDAPLKVEVDADKAILLYGGADMGVAFLPHKDVSEEAVKKSDKDVTPLGVLFFYHLTLMIDKKPVPQDKLRLIKVMVDGQDVQVPAFYIGVKTETDGKRQVLIYGKEKEPLLKATLNDLETQGDRPVIIEAKGVGAGEGTLNVNVLKKFQAVVPLKAAF